MVIDLTVQTPEWLDEFASLANSGTPGVEIITNKEIAMDGNAPHGLNTEAEMVANGPVNL